MAGHLPMHGLWPWSPPHVRRGLCPSGSITLDRGAPAATGGGTSYATGQSFQGCDKALLPNVDCSTATSRSINAGGRHTDCEQRVLSARWWPGQCTGRPYRADRPLQHQRQQWANASHHHLPRGLSDHPGRRRLLRRPELRARGSRCARFPHGSRSSTARRVGLLRMPRRLPRSGRWHMGRVYIDASTAPQASEVDLARGTSRIAAICELWRNRHLAKRQLV